jgi:hypothetical protein
VSDGVRSPLKFEEMLFLSYEKQRHEERATPAPGIVGTDSSRCASGAGGRDRDQRKPSKRCLGVSRGAHKASCPSAGLGAPGASERGHCL